MIKDKLSRYCKKGISYIKDYRFSSIFIKYFLLLFICLVVPVSVLSVRYSRKLRENTDEEILQRNEATLLQAYDNVNAAVSTTKNTVYSLTRSSSVQYLATRSSINEDTTGNRDNLLEMISLIRNANDYIDSIYLYFSNSQDVISETGVSSIEDFSDREIFEDIPADMQDRTVLVSRVKGDKYPYLLSVLHVIKLGRGNNVGLAVINIDVEKLGDYIGSGKYRITDDSPKLLIFNDAMETLVYSDEYRLYQNSEDLVALKQFKDTQTPFSSFCRLWGTSYIVSGVYSPDDGLRYLYLSTIEDYAEKNRAADTWMKNAIIVVSIVCLILALVLAVWVYRPILKTIDNLSAVSMLTQWDRKEHVDEIEAIQRSILSAKKERDDLNEQVKERLVSLHNAQICALQTQIDPHFLFNTLEVIGNAAALMFNGENQVTDMIYTLSKMMRISLSNENYLVPLEEELEHVRLYVKIVDFRYHGRISLHQEIPESLYQERIVKLTLQPLIENSIQHGLARKRDNGEIWLRGEKQNNDIFLYISDNGTGVTQKELEELKVRLQTTYTTGSSHIGMQNVNQRLKLIFGEEYGLSVAPAQEGGLCVIIHFKSI